NVDLGKGGLAKDAQLVLELTGGLRFASFELGIIGGKLAIPLTEPGGPPEVSMDGLDISMKIGPAIISGSFLKSGAEFAGLLTIDLPKLSIGAMGFYGPLLALKMTPDAAVITELKANRFHADLRSKLNKEQIVPADRPKNLRRLRDLSWEFSATDGRSFS